jgi:peptidoglycan/xylan/chitin deacetylase (PgdA/CDA1 family)
MKARKPLFEKGMFIISIDVDVGSRQLGVLNKGLNDANISSHFSERVIGRAEERAIPFLIRAFDNFMVPVTFAIRGQLVEVDNSIINLLQSSPIKYDIGAHGYYHKSFVKSTVKEAEQELQKIDLGMKGLDISVKSFVFPRNQVAHLNLLAKYGYECYRSSGGLLRDDLHIEKQDSLFNIRPSVYVSQGSDSYLLRKLLDIAISRRLSFHIWFHPWDFGQDEHQIRKYVDKILAPLLQYARRKEERGMLTIETMLSAAQKARKQL